MTFFPYGCIFSRPCVVKFTCAAHSGVVPCINFPAIHELPHTHNWIIDMPAKIARLEVVQFHLAEPSLLRISHPVVAPHYDIAL
jgi:hypothetical protein